MHIVQNILDTSGVVQEVIDGLGPIESITVSYRCSLLSRRPFLFSTCSDASVEFLSRFKLRQVFHLPEVRCSLRLQETGMLCAMPKAVRLVVAF